MMPTEESKRQDRILMTGSTSFVGRYLVKILEKCGYEIWHLVRNKKGFKNEVVWDFISPLSEEMLPCHVIVHLAAYVNFDKELESLQYNVNTVSTMKLVAYAQVYNAYIIFASMAGVHERRCTVINDNTPVNPPNHYAMSKYLSEEVIKSFLKNYSILRISGIYGIDGPEHLGLNSAIRNAVRNKEVPVLKGQGKARRNYICVNDVAHWISYLIEQYERRKHREKTTVSEMLYLAGSEVMTIKEYLELIVETLMPGKELVKMDAPESQQDLVVNASPVPFPQISFKKYLQSLSSKASKN